MNNIHRHYLDANASSRIRPVVKEEIQSLLESYQGLGNPSAVHCEGRKTRSLIRCARANIIKSLGFQVPESVEMVFTSGGTESCNLMIRGLVSDRCRHVISSAVEHAAVLEELLRLESAGTNVSLVPCGSLGQTNCIEFLSRLKPETDLVILQGANSETGAIQPVMELAKTLRDDGYDGLILSDCTQLLGKSKIQIGDLIAAGVDAIALSGHKIGSLTGIGALLISRKRCLKFSPQILGGGQEFGFRSGSENLFGIFSFASAVSSLKEDPYLKLSPLRDILWKKLANNIITLKRITPENNQALANTLMIRTPGIRGDDLVAALDVEGISVSVGSACSSGKQEASRSLMSMGYSKKEAREAFRISLDWDTTKESLDGISCIIIEVIGRFNTL